MSEIKNPPAGQFFNDGDNDPNRRAEIRSLDDPEFDAAAKLAEMSLDVKRLEEDASQDINIAATGNVYLYELYAIKSLEAQKLITLTETDRATIEDLILRLELLAPSVG